MLINTYMDLFNKVCVINYTKFEHFVSSLWAKVQFLGKIIEFFNRIIFCMRTHLLLCLQFMLFGTYMDLVNWIYAINYTKFEHFGPKCPAYWEKSSLMGIFKRIILYMRAFSCLRLQFMLNNTYMDLFS
jgi:hypothetical protein